MEFRKICPECKKTYVNGAIGTCGECRVVLVKIKHSYTIIDDKIVTIVYKFEKEENGINT